MSSFDVPGNTVSPPFLQPHSLIAPPHNGYVLVNQNDKQKLKNIFNEEKKELHKDIFF